MVYGGHATGTRSRPDRIMIGTLLYHSFFRENLLNFVPE